MKGVEHIFFDLDHTLWDFDRNATDTLTDLYVKYELKDKLKVATNYYLSKYFEINDYYWDLFDKGLANKEDFRVTRFIKLFDFFGFKDDALAKVIDDEYIDTCPQRGKLLEGAVDVLNYLTLNYELHIITNGFKEIQEIKMKSSEIDHFFSSMTTSECAKGHKPSPVIFKKALERSKALVNNSIFIGDNPATDIDGAARFGFRTVWYNSRSLERGDLRSPDFEIKSLLDLKEIF